MRGGKRCAGLRGGRGGIHELRNQNEGINDEGGMTMTARHRAEGQGLKNPQIWLVNTDLTRPAIGRG